MLTSDQIEKLCMQELLGKPSGIKGKEAEAFLTAFRNDIQTARKNKWIIELPFEIPDMIGSSDVPGNFELSSEDGWEYYTKAIDESPGYEVYRKRGDNKQIFNWDQWKWSDVD